MDRYIDLLPSGISSIVKEVSAFSCHLHWRTYAAIGIRTEPCRAPRVIRGRTTNKLTTLYHETATILVLATDDPLVQ